MMGDHRQTLVITPHRSSTEDFLNLYRNVSIHLKHRSLVSDGAMHDAKQGGLSLAMSRGSNCQWKRLDLQMTWRPGTHYSLLSLDQLMTKSETFACRLGVVYGKGKRVTNPRRRSTHD